MPVRFQHDKLDNCLYFITFTCFKWKCLFELSDAYSAVFKWFDSLYENNNRVTGYVIMPNHVHAMLYFSKMIKSLNTIIGNAKRFIAYDIIQSLEDKNETGLLEELHSYVKKNEGKKGQRHKVFEESFDAKECYTRKFITQKFEYMHKNPVSKKWQLVKDFTEYPYSSASFYENGILRYDKILHVAEVW
jgi:REP element-mobilizing transposase RayT